eukprot:TRINITY_DN14896_c0_g1_i1.p1 TRINITY_DN14896_c0_g1~~TRINITY_DN14896_c0_g1_i1.p1  ORF type:complete len:1152 (-),score=87.20 TRINITY_DN14896_c0_g1_i1:531-3986(-)
MWSDDSNITTTAGLQSFKSVKARSQISLLHKDTSLIDESWQGGGSVADLRKSNTNQSRMVRPLASKRGSAGYPWSAGTRLLVPVALLLLSILLSAPVSTSAAKRARRINVETAFATSRKGRKSSLDVHVAVISSAKLETSVGSEQFQKNVSKGASRVSACNHVSNLGSAVNNRLQSLPWLPPAVSDAYSSKGLHGQSREVDLPITSLSKQDTLDDSDTKIPYLLGQEPTIGLHAPPRATFLFPRRGANTFLTGNAFLSSKSVELSSYSKLETSSHSRHTLSSPTGNPMRHPPNTKLSLSGARPNQELLVWNDYDTHLAPPPSASQHSKHDTGMLKNGATQSATRDQAHTDGTQVSGATDKESETGKNQLELSKSDKHLIPGSAVKSPKGAKVVRSVISCQGRKGKWKFNPKPRKLPWPPEVSMYSTACDADRLKIGEILSGGENGKDDKGRATGEEEWSRVPDSMKWEWKPESCFWEEFEYERFCRAMHGKWGRHAQILIMGGDHMFGLEQRFFATMVATRPQKAPMVALFPHVYRARHQLRDRSGLRYCFDVLAGDSVSVVYYRNRVLAIKSEDVMLGDESLSGAMQRYPPSAVVFNHEYEEIPLKEFKARLRSVITWIRTKGDILIIYMASPIAPQCFGPASQNRSQLGNVSSHEEAYKRQNAAAKEIVVSHGALFVDLNPTLAAWVVKDRNSESKSREASCVNGCLPGVGDAWVALLHNALLVALKGELEDQSKLRGAGRQEGATLTEGTNLQTSESQSRLWESKMAEVRRDHTNGEKEGLLVLQAYTYKAPPFPPRLTALVPGSGAVRSVEEWTEAQSLFDCYATKGMWVYNNTPRSLPWHRGGLKIPVCDTYHEEHGGLMGEKADQVALKGGQEWNVREATKWEWQTEAACPLEHVTREDLCRLLGPGRQIMFLGDSITQSFFYGFYNKLVEGRDLEKHPVKWVDPMLEWEIGGRVQCLGLSNACSEFFEEGVTLRFCLNDHLTLTMMPLFRQTPWASKLEEWNPSIVHLNMGTHFMEDKDLLEKSRESLAFIRTALPTALIVWRALHPGHKDCANFTGPIATRQDPETLPFHWGQFSHQNTLMKPVVAQVGAVWMDIEPMTVLRPDGHYQSSGGPKPGGDCLHYCLPGPVDTWVVLFYHILKRLL